MMKVVAAEEKYVGPHLEKMKSLLLVRGTTSKAPLKAPAQMRDPDQGTTHSTVSQASWQAILSMISDELRIQGLGVICSPL
jgi:hypothetical protein